MSSLCFHETIFKVIEIFMSLFNFYSLHQNKGVLSEIELEVYGFKYDLVIS